MQQAMWKYFVLSGVVLGASRPAIGQAQRAPQPDPAIQACGLENTQFKMKRDATDAGAMPPAGQALVYVVELMPAEGGLTTHVKLGMDGTWRAQLSARTFVSFTVEPGVHHVCARYEGVVAASQIDPTVLHRVEVEAGKTYYLLYRGFITRDAGQIGLLDLVDEDEGRHAIAEADRLQATVVKR